MADKALKLIGIGVLAATGLSGCLLGPDYMRTDQPVGAAFSEPSAEGESFANLAWWDVFTDPVLQGLIRESLSQNKDLKVAAARIEQARALLTYTRADQLPRIDLSGGAKRQRASENILFAGKNPHNDFGIFGDLSFELDIWGKLRRATEAEEAALLSTEYTQRAIVMTLVSQVATSYFRILGLEDRIVIADETISNRAGNTKLVRQRFSKGVVPELDVNQAEIEEAGVRASRTDFERDLKQTEHALAILLGHAPGTIARGKTLSQQSMRDIVPAGYPADLLERRPDVLAAEANLRAAVAEIGVAEANRLPTLTLLGFIGLESEQGRDFIDAGSFTWSIGGSLLGPLLDFGKSKSVQEAREAEAKAALSSYEQTVIQAVSEVDDALVAIKTSKEAYNQRSAQIKAASNASRLSHARYDEGVTSYLEVLDVERSLFDAQIGASNSREAYLSSIIQLYKALGGGWRDQENSASQPNT